MGTTSEGEAAQEDRLMNSSLEAEETQNPQNTQATNNIPQIQSLYT